MTIHIEIARRDRGYGKVWDLRIGDVKGSTEISNSSKEKVLEDISVEMDSEASIEDKRFEEEFGVKEE